MGRAFERIPHRGASPVRQCCAEGRTGLRRADRPRNRQAAVGIEDRGHIGHQQGRNLDRGLRRAHTAAPHGSRARQQDRGSPQAPRRACRAGAIQFPGPSAQWPHRPGADRRQCGGVQAVGKDARGRRVARPLPSRSGHSRRRRPLADRRPRRGAQPRQPARHRRPVVHRLGSRRHGAPQAIRGNSAQDPRARAWRQ